MSRPDSVTLTFTRHRGAIAVHPSGSPGRRAPSCTWRLEMWVSNPAPPEGIGPRPNEESDPYMIFCDDAFVRVTWLGPQNVLDLDTAGRAIAERIVREIGVPAISVRINPQEGLAGLDSWFWITGYDGAPINRTVQELGLTVDVRIRRGTVAWDFGDGSEPVSGDLGRAYPARSTVVHTYTDRSAGRPYSVTARLALEPEYRVDGGAWVALPPIALADSASYAVREVQAVIQ